MADELAVSRPPTLADFGHGSGRVVTSQSLDTIEGRREFLRAFGECDMRLTENVNTPLIVKNYMVHDVVLRGRSDGEEVAATRMVLFLADGKTANCVSDTLLDSFKKLMWAYNGVIPDGGLSIVVKMRKKEERSIYWFEEVARPDQPARRGK